MLPCWFVYTHHIGQAEPYRFTYLHITRILQISYHIRLWSWCFPIWLLAEERSQIKCKEGRKPFVWPACPQASWEVIPLQRFAFETISLKLHLMYSTSIKSLCDISLLYGLWLLWDDYYRRLNYNNGVGRLSILLGDFKAQGLYSLKPFSFIDYFSICCIDTKQMNKFQNKYDTSCSIFNYPVFV